MSGKHILRLNTAFLILFAAGALSAEGIELTAPAGPVTVPAGTKAVLPVKVDIPPRSHFYGNPKGPGTGKPVEITVKADVPLRAGEIRITRPARYTAKGSSENVWIHENGAVIFVTVEVPNDAKAAEYSLRVDVDALLCTDTSCIPQRTGIDIPLKIPSGAAGAYRLTPRLTKLLADSQVIGSHSAMDKSAPDSDPKKTNSSTFSPEYIGGSSVSGILQAIMLGLIAGFILNFMPCVLPVVSLKLMSFARNAGSSRAKLIKLGLSFSAGIVASFTVLAALAAFFGYSWGGLFQHRAFLTAMTAVVFALAMSLFGLFSVNIPSFAGKQQNTKSGYGDAFGKGLLATLLATPCSGPFLGGTLAWTLNQHPAVIFAVFISIGAGMAIPYLLMTAAPSFMRFIPKPGPWLGVFEKAMGFLLVLTTVYLISLFEPADVMPVILFLALLTPALWLYGKYGSPINPKKQRIIASSAAVITAIAAWFISFVLVFSPSAEKTEIQSVVKSKFSIERLGKNASEGRISIVKFTADWCPNCKVVERISLNDSRVQEAIAKSGAELLTSDITRPYPDAEKLLKELGSRSIPFLAVFPPGDEFARPVCLRDMYSASDVVEALKSAEGRIKPSGENFPVKEIEDFGHQ